MPYEDDYKMWLEKMLIESNPDWVCDEMSNNEFTHNWCHQYCGEEDAYITPKCLHMYYHHIERADRKTENSSVFPNNSTISKMEQVETMSCQECKHFHENAVMYLDQCDFCFKDCKYEPKDEPQTDCAWR